MKILRITRTEDGMIEVKIRGNNGTPPRFPADISAVNLQAQLRMWKKKQEHAEEPESSYEVPATLKALEGTVVPE